MAKSPICPSRVSTARGAPVRLRTALLVAGIAAVLGVGWALDLYELVTVDSLRGAMERAGPWGVLGFLAAFALSAPLGLPAVAFVLAALVSYGLEAGLPVAFLGSLLAASSSFLVVRLARGTAEDDAVRRPTPRLIGRALGALERQPIAVVALLRSVLMLSAPLNLALALSRLRYREYLAGTAVGLVPPLLFYAITLDCWLG